ncbi:hypothetical protein CCO03_17675 [Comamonas serinivorans]|uniref:DUF898 domain-containing protein n=2 Tax=Comamonas serinivorans TaxID=1082851 RepID=A0A1Y0ESB2_9BURK|nr:hypothetical protein CCO03_17675 [Comamonas serinivorans]
MVNDPVQPGTAANADVSAAQPRPPIHSHPLHFAGTGQAYFRVWLVNVVLTVVTLGFFTPYARRRTASYFYNHTEVAGSPLEFTASIRRMMVGFLIVTAAYVAYELASFLEYEWAVNVMLVLAAVAAPFLWGSAMRFRTRATRWRGLRPLFVARWGEIYRQSWPVFAIALVWIGVVVAFNYSGLQRHVELAQAMEALQERHDDLQAQISDLEDASDTPDEAELAPLRAELQTVEDQLAAPPYQAYDDYFHIYIDAVKAKWHVLAAIGVAGVVATLPFVVLLEFNYRRLFVTRTQIGGLFGHWKPVYGDFLRVWIATIGVSVLVLVLAGALFTGLGVMAAAALSMGSMGMMIWAGLLVAVLWLAFIVFAFSPILAYKQARMFQLLWNNIGVGPLARFKCKLNAWAFVRLRLWNLLLTALTLGFYRPYARVAEYRMKLESVTLYVKGDLDELQGRLSQEQGALGDAFADLIGLDLIS